ncbi:Leucine-rich repeat protein [Mactra antiquata]
MCILLSMFLLYVMLNNYVAATVNSTCSLSKETLTCNYVPNELPAGVLSVTIKDFMLDTDLFVIHEGLFQSESWKNVKYLTYLDSQDTSSKIIILKNTTFIGFHGLKMLRINIVSKINIEPNAFLGLKNVNTLNFSGCKRLELDQLMNALNGTDKVPNLENLILQQIYYYHGFNFTRTYSRCLKGKPLKTLDLSKTQLANFEYAIVNDFPDLEILNLSQVIFQHFNSRGMIGTVEPAEVHHIGYDTSYSISGSMLNPFTINTYANVKIPIDKINPLFPFFIAHKMVNASGVNIGKPLLLYNIEVWSVHKFKSLTNQLVLKQNKLQRLDVKFECNNFDMSSINHIDLSENGLEYLHPSLLTCLTGIEDLDLSSNNLNAMQKEDVQQFCILLKNTTLLKYINLASNQLVDISYDFFEGCTKLVNINLAGNRLTQVHFKLDHLQSLSVIDISSNNICILDSMTMKQLDALRIDREPSLVNAGTKNLASSNGYISNNRHVRVKGNPFTCDTCKTLSSIRWLVSTTITESRPDELTCIGESDTNISLAEAVAAVQGICERKMKIIVITITSVVVSVICVGAVVLIYFKRKRSQKQRRRHDVIELLRQDETHFAVFLSFCSKDDDFVQEIVIGPLNDGLQKLVGTERNLVCVGDSEFRLGIYIHNESLRCIELCPVVLCVVSDSYCNSNYCVQEFNHAMQKTKPVILMMKGDVDIDLMNPAMQLLFHNQVRMLWEDNNGEYQLKTSWENVCKSIIDIASEQQ